MEKQILLSEILEEIKEYNTYSLIDEVEISEGLYITILHEDDKLLVHYNDYNNMECGGYALYLEDLKNLTQKDFESLLNEIYYYNCNIPIED